MDRQFVLNEFQIKFNKPKIKTFEQIIQLVNMNKTVRKWFKDLKYEQTILSEMPNAYLIAGYTVSDWIEGQKERDIIKDINREASKKSAQLAKTFDNEMEKVNRARSEALSRISWFTKLNSISVNELPEDMQVEVIMETDGEKKKLLIDALIEKFKSSLLIELRETGSISTDPFA